MNPAITAPPSSAEGPATLPPGIFKLLVLNTLCFVSFAIITPVLDELIRVPFGVDNSGTGKFMAVHGVASLIFGVAAGVFSDRLGRRVPLIALGLIGSGVTTALIPRIGHFPTLLAVRFADGVFGAFSLGLIITRALDLCGPANRNRTMGVLSISIAAGFVLAPVLTGIFLHKEVVARLGGGSLKLLFGLVGGALVAGGLWMLAELRATESVTPSAGGPLTFVRALIARPKLIIPVSFAFVDKFTFGTLGHLTALTVADLHGGDAFTSSAILLGFWLAFSLVCVPGGKLCDRFGALPMLIAGSLLYGTCMATLGVTGLGGFAALMALAGVFCAIQYVPSVALVGEIAAPTGRGASMGIWNMAGSLGVVFGMVMSGRLSGISYALAYGVAGGLEITAALVWLVWAVANRGRNEKNASDSETEIAARRSE